MRAAHEHANRALGAAYNGNTERAVALLSTAVRRLQSCSSRDLFLEASCLRALAQIAAERFDRGAWAVVEEQRSLIDWSASGLRGAQCAIAMSAAYFANGTEGNALEAASAARLAEKLAPDAAYRAQSLCVRASIGRFARESLSHRDYVNAALEAFADVEPGSLIRDRDLLPLALAEELAAAGRAPEGRLIFEQYLVSRELASAERSSVDSIWREGCERSAMGALLIAESRTAEAQTEFRAAYDTFRRGGYLRRAVISALCVVEQKPNDDYLWGFIDASAASIARSSWIRLRITSLKHKPGDMMLTGMQRECLKLVCDGKSNPEIARLRGRSVHTVRNQLVPLFEIFGVQSRAALVAECLRSGVLQA